jgi:hypothetical protein
MSTNGRINIMGPMDQNIFNLYDKIPVNQNSTSFNEALTGNWSNNLLSRAFFSAENVEILQNALKAGVYKLSNSRYIIAKQNEDTLKIIMRSVFLQHSVNLETNITEQIVALNKIVSDYCVPKLLGEAEGYIKYKSDVSNLAVPIKRPVSTYHSNTLEMKNFF